MQFYVNLIALLYVNVANAVPLSTVMYSFEYTDLQYVGIYIMGIRCAVQS